MDQFFAGTEYTGKPFELFGLAHLIALGLVLLFNLSFLFLRRSPNSKINQYVRYGMGVLLITNEIMWHIWNIKTGQWSIQTTLPLHICSLFVILNSLMLFTDNYRIYEFAYFLGIGGALQSLLTPDAGMWGFPHFRFFQAMLSHGLIVSSAIYMTVVQGFRPYWSSLRRVLIGSTIYMVIIFVLNFLIGSNYLFIAHKPETASLMDVLPEWPWYILYVIAIALLVFLLLYIPFAIKDLRKVNLDQRVNDVTSRTNPDL
ncbi:MAG: TIGR02206 family membrane protein [Anaerolineaceae bacterium]|nr:TIGR02206 family membrane protein [Anaerolineaceae bacterium]